MCGIFGSLERRNNFFKERELNLDSLAHRGPDGRGVWKDNINNVLLCHRRLSIIDLSEEAAQPMENFTSALVITYNGEIYNYFEVREYLRKFGSRFRTESDTEVILNAYEILGERCLELLNGMFAFVIYDKNNKKLFCARDRNGEKPFYFISNRDFFAFASEYKALLKISECSLDFDEYRLLRGLHNASVGLDADRQTVFKDIQQLLPAEAMSVDVNTLECKIWRYWDLQPREEYARLSETDAFALFGELLTDSIRLRLRSDVPVGSCLSGGLDSSAIVCLVRQKLLPDGEYHTFTGRFPGTSADEWRYAEEVVRAARVTSHVVEPTAEGFAAELADFMWYNELPVGSSSQYAQWCVFRLAREHGVTVLLDGQGADELLGGYEQYFRFYLDALRETGQVDRLKAEEPRIRARYPLALAPPARVLRDRLPFGVRRWLSHRLGKGTNLLYGLKPEVARRVAEENQRARVERFHALGSALYQDSFGMFLTTLLRYGDRNSMAHSREVRLPFCDHRLAELALSLPPQHLMGEVQTKRLLRESMRGVLPESIRTRWNKQGFRPPQDLWMRGTLLSMVEEIITDGTFAKSGIWDVNWWRIALQRFKEGNSNLAWILWQPFMMEKWRRHFWERVHQDRASVA